jgi:hypothetical protein
LDYIPAAGKDASSRPISELPLQELLPILLEYGWRLAHPSQLPQAKLAAQSYLDAMARIDSENKKEDPVSSKPGSAKAYGYREQAVRQQLAALNVLQASMTPAQADRLRNQAMKEIHIVDTGTSEVQVTRPEK